MEDRYFCLICELLIEEKEEIFWAPMTKYPTHYSCWRNLILAPKK